MNNQNFEFKSYIPTPTDKYGVLGLAKVKLYGKLLNVYKHLKTKDGNSTFFCMANYSMEDAMNEKKYLTASQLCDRDDEESLFEFIRENVNKVINQRSAHKQNVQAQQAPAAYYPHGMAQNTQPAALPHEVAADEQLPF